MLDSSTDGRDWERTHDGRGDPRLKLAIFGANGRIGSAVVREALQRGHMVTAAVRSVSSIQVRHHGLIVVEARISDALNVGVTVAGHDAVVDSIGGLGHDNPRISVECIRPLVSGMLDAGVDRLLVVGTAGTLRVPDGGMRKDQDDFPDRLRLEAQAHYEVLEYLRHGTPRQLRWTYFSPPALIEDGERTGNIRLGRDDLMFDESGRSFISTQDFALATLDELEAPNHVRVRFTAISEGDKLAKQ